MEKQPPSGKSQRDKFIQTARAIGCDEDESAFKERLKTLVAAPLAPQKTAGKPKAKKPDGGK
jgi:hypothetical protein